MGVCGCCVDGMCVCVSSTSFSFCVHIEKSHWPYPASKRSFERELLEGYIYDDTDEAVVTWNHDISRYAGK